MNSQSATSSNSSEKVKKIILERKIKAEYLTFNQSCHSVAEAAAAAGVTPQDFVKNICFIDHRGNPIIAIVKGEDHISRTKIGEFLEIPPPKQATPEETLQKTGFPCGGIPSFGFTATFLIDERVMEKEIVYSSGGSDTTLIKISPTEIIRANNGKVARIRK